MICFFFFICQRLLSVRNEQKYGAYFGELHAVAKSFKEIRAVAAFIH